MRITAVRAAPALKSVALFRSFFTCENSLRTFFENLESLLLEVEEVNVSLAVVLVESDDSELFDIVSAFSESLCIDSELVGILWVRLHCPLTFERPERAVIHGLDVGEYQPRSLTGDDAVRVSLDSAAINREAETHSLVGVDEEIASDVPAIGAKPADDEGFKNSAS